MRQHPPQWRLWSLWDSPCVVPVAASGSALKGTRGAVRRAERRVQSFHRFERASTGLSVGCEEGGGTTRSAPSPSTCRDRDGDGPAGRARRWREAGRGANRGVRAKAGREANRGACGWRREQQRPALGGRWGLGLPTPSWCPPRVGWWPGPLRSCPSGPRGSSLPIRSD